MRVIVCGVGRVGFSLAEHLTRARGFEVSVVDTDPAQVRRCSALLDVEGVVGHASHPEVLARAGAEQARMMIAVTGADEVNLLAAQVCDTFFDVPDRVARIRHPAYLDTEWSELFGERGVPVTRVISPERDVAIALMRRLRLRAAVEVLPLAGKLGLFLGFRADATTTILGRPLREVGQLFPEIEATLVALGRAGSVRAAHSTDRLEVGDVAYFVVSRDHAERLQRAYTGVSEETCKRIHIFGAGNVGLNLERALARAPEFADATIRILERDKESATRAAERLADGVVRRGNVMDETFLQGEDLGESDVAVAVTNSDETNLLSCVLAKRLGCKRTLALVSEPSLESLVEPLGVDGALNPRELVYSAVIRHLRRGRILFLYSLPQNGGDLFVAELLDKSSPLLGRRLRMISLPKGLRIGAVVRERRLVQPRGDTEFRLGDSLIFYAEAGARPRVEALLAASGDF